MYLHGICLLFVTVALTQNIHDQLVSGLCLCIEDNDVFARADRKFLIEQVQDYTYFYLAWLYTSFISIINFLANENQDKQ